MFPYSGYDKNGLPRGLTPEEARVQTIGGLILMSLFGTILFLYKVVPPLWQSFVAAYSPTFVQNSLTIAILVVVSFLFWLRNTKLLIYALLEIAFGIVSVWMAAGLFRELSVKWPALVGAAYFVIRGCDNYKKAIEAGLKISDQPEAPPEK